ncbi:DUF5710 domain-containing protein [Capnocytophaga cynodegmi]|uniref:DUF5710 domain-containing protein n=1 Tax=Capnocytophaga cynodegmi TaxID=28189 RepID=UPI001ACDFC14|nr:DUF5710 domain-containing protein [Capnocytophaga cynodegmi]GIM55547.1 hypothetical protein CAPN005_21940 [Capnocytophaga cynodegmi]
MPYKLNVPFSEKDIAKSKGAFWDSFQKTWFVPDHKDINDFKQWIDTENIKIIIKAPFYLALNTRECWRCKNEIPVISLYSDNFYQLDYSGENAEYETFEKVEAKSFFSEIVFLDSDISKFLKQNFTFFKLGFSKTINDKYWANHCIKCNSLQGDFFNHSEPGGPFCPVTEDECAKLTLVELPFKFDIGINGGFSISSNEDEIFALATKKIWKGS